MSAIKLDEIDLRILSTLQRDGRITNLDLAERVGLSASPCLYRVRRLEKARLIRRYGAQLDAGRFLRHIFGYVELTLESHRSEDFARFERFAATMDEMVSCALISGDFDYLAQFVATDVTHFHDIMGRLMEAQVGVGRHFTYIVLKKVKDTWEIPLEALRHADRRASDKRAGEKVR